MSIGAAVVVVASRTRANASAQVARQIAAEQARMLKMLRSNSSFE